VLKVQFSLSAFAPIAAVGLLLLLVGLPALAQQPLAGEAPQTGMTGPSPATPPVTAPPPVAAAPTAPAQPEADDVPAAAAPGPETVADYASQGAVIDLGPALAETRVTDPAQPGVAWFTVYVENSGNDLVSRVLLAVDPPGAGVSFSPPYRRPTLIEAAGSDSSVIIERAAAFGPNAFRVVLPPSHSTALALHFDGVGPAPTLLAWTETALIAHNRQIALLAGAIGGLFTAALAFAAGAAAFGGRPFAKWAAFFLASLLLAFLTSSRAFDDGWLTAFGGPYGLFALALSFSLAAGSRLIDHVAPYEAFRPWARLWADRVAILMVVFGVAALLGLPGVGLLLRLSAVVGAAAAAGYLTHCGRLGVAGARRLAPAATIFALVTAVATFRSLGLLGTGIMAPAIIAGFSAVGAVLVALTSAVASAEPTVARLGAMRQAHLQDDVQATTTDEGIAETREHSAVIASHQGIFDLDLDSGLLSLSGEASQILGLSDKAEEIAHDAWLRHLYPEDRDVYIQALETYRHQPDLAFRMEFRAKRPDGQIQWYELRATMIGQATEPERCLGLIANVTARKEADIQQDSPLLDKLTGLGNRLALFQLLEDAQKEFARIALVIVDLDRFKAVDASLGAAGADWLLRAVAERLDERFRKRGKVFRVGGDMFAVVAPKPNNMLTLGAAVMDCMVKPFLLNEREIFLPASAGLATGDIAEDAQDLVGKAELAMIQAKREGGGRASIYSAAMLAPEPQPATGDPISLDTSLRRAVERNEIEVHYQPIMRVTDGSVAGFEALLRWNHPQFGIIEPGEFIPYAERSGLILPLGRIALARAAEDLARWQHFFPLEPALFVSVNISWRQVEAAEFAGEVKALIERSGLAPHTLRLELTESAVMQGAKSAEEELKKLRALGAGLAIDDFGTGHSSLSHLRRFPFDAVKIDKSFLAAGEKEHSILASIVKLAHGIGLQIVAEGVETQEEAKRLQELGCEYAQGFFFGVAMPASQIPNFIAMTYAR
jgi:diguanylate cyclase (GGDEF)-like protein/PAS domain S-box-containing protein